MSTKNLKLPKNLKLLTLLKGIDEREAHETFGASYSYLRLIAYGHKQPSATVATKIEQGTRGLITRRELRPDWQAIWPELITPEVNLLAAVEHCKLLAERINAACDKRLDDNTLTHEEALAVSEMFQSSQLFL